MSVTDEIKARIDLVSYVQRYVPTLKKAGRNHKACCPFHNEKSPSFIVNPERQTWHCFGACSEGGDLFTFAQKANGWDFKEALRELAAEAGLQLRAQTPEQKSESDRLDALRGLVNTAAESFQRRLFEGDAASVLGYVREARGLSDETIREFQLGYAPESWDWLLNSLRRLGYRDEDIVDVGLAVRSEKGRIYDRFRNRLMIPIRDERGRVVGFGGRALGLGDNAKYINSPQSALFDKSRLLFGLDMGRRAIRETGTAVVVEGYMDVIQAHQAGYRNVVAQMGTAMTAPQIQLLEQPGAKKIVISLDADAAGLSAARRSLDRAENSELNVKRETLSPIYNRQFSIDIRVVTIPSGKDPDDFIRETPDGWQTLVSEAIELSDFVIETAMADLPQAPSLQEKLGVAEAVWPLLRLSENNIYREENIQKLSRRLRIDERDLMSWTRDKLPVERPVGAQAPPSDAPPEFWAEDDATLPPEASEFGEPSAGAAAAPASGRPAERAIEPYCLSLLLKNPNLLYLVNRRLRELADGDDDLLQGPLRALGVEDFTQSAYRILMARLQDSMAQAGREPLEYLASVIGEDLQSEYEALLVEPPEAVSQSLRRNFQADLNDIFRRRLFRSGARTTERDELISRALELRLARLDNERIEMQYLQEEAQAGGDGDQRHSDQLKDKIMLSMRAKARINQALSRRSLPLKQASIS